MPTSTLTSTLTSRGRMLSVMSPTRRFTVGANMSKVFLGMDMPFRAKTRELEIEFLKNGIQKWDFFTYGTPADLML